MAGLTFREVVVKGSIMGAIIAIPTLVVFLGLWWVVGDLMIAAVGGAAAHFIALVFAFRLAKRFLVSREPSK